MSKFFALPSGTFVHARHQSSYKATPQNSSLDRSRTAGRNDDDANSIQDSGSVYTDDEQDNGRWKHFSRSLVKASCRSLLGRCVKIFDLN